MERHGVLAGVAPSHGRCPAGPGAGTTGRAVRRRAPAFHCTGLRDPLAQGRALRDRGAGTVVVTMGGAGCMVSSGAGELRVGSLPVECVDPSGGGDAFAAGLIDGLLRDWPLRRCRPARSCVQAVGCHDGVHDRETTTRLLDTMPPAVDPT